MSFGVTFMYIISELYKQNISGYAKLGGKKAVRSQLFTKHYWQLGNAGSRGGDPSQGRAHQLLCQS